MRDLMLFIWRIKRVLHDVKKQPIYTSVSGMSANLHPSKSLYLDFRKIPALELSECDVYIQCVLNGSARLTVCAAKSDIIKKISVKYLKKQPTQSSQQLAHPRGCVPNYRASGGQKLDPALRNCTCWWRTDVRLQERGQFRFVRGVCGDP